MAEKNVIERSPMFGPIHSFTTWKLIFYESLEQKREEKEEKVDQN